MVENQLGLSLADFEEGVLGIGRIATAKLRQVQGLNNGGDVLDCHCVVVRSPFVISLIISDKRWKEFECIVSQCGVTGVIHTTAYVGHLAV